MNESRSVGRHKAAPICARLIATPHLQVLRCLDRYLLSRDGDVKKLQHPQTGFRLRCGDYRLFFDFLGEDAIEITAIRNRREAYR